MSIHNLCFEQNYEKFQFLEVKFSIYLNRHVSVMDILWPSMTLTPSAVEIQNVNDFKMPKIQTAEVLNDFVFFLNR